MEFGPSLIANRQAAKASEPGQRALDHPAMAAESFARLDPPPGDTRRNATLAAGQATTGIVVALIGVQLERTPPRPATSTAWLADRRDRI